VSFIRTFGSIHFAFLQLRADLEHIRRLHSDLSLSLSDSRAAAQRDRDLAEERQQRQAHEAEGALGAVAAQLTAQEEAAAQLRAELDRSLSLVQSERASSAAMQLELSAARREGEEAGRRLVGAEQRVVALAQEVRGLQQTNVDATTQLQAQLSAVTAAFTEAQAQLSAVTAAFTEAQEGLVAGRSASERAAVEAAA
jgi:chromosome segregation ATPase